MAAVSFVAGVVAGSMRDDARTPLSALRERLGKCKDDTTSV